MTEPLFTVRVELKTSEEHEIGYSGVTEALRDEGLRALFEGELVKACSIHANAGKMRITASPITTWERLAHQLTSNSSILLRGATA